jgi:putative effector of murein hydrolase LrgA (UPF0299 family)
MFIAAAEAILAAWRVTRGEWIWVVLNISVAVFFCWLVIELVVKEVIAHRPAGELE